MKKIKAALASFGMSGQTFHGPLLQAHNGFEIVSILERTNKLSAEKYPDARIVRSYKELMNDSGIELVIINTPDRLHYEMAKMALETGKNVVVEKPFVQKSSQAEELIKIAGSKKLLLSVFQNRRWDGDFLTVQRIINNGLLGRLVEYEAHFDRFRNFIQDATWKEEKGAGTLVNLGSHLIDQALLLFGMPGGVTANIRKLREGSQVDDSFRIWLDYPQIRVMLEASYLVREPGPRYQVHGTNGSYLKYGIDPQEEDLKAGKIPIGDDWGRENESKWGILNTEMQGLHFHGKIETIPGDYMAYYDNIYQCIAGGFQPAVSAREALNGIRIIEAARVSNDTGKTVLIGG